MISRVFRRALAAVAALGCGASSITVRSYPHPEGAPAEVVGFMPPPAQIEHLDLRPPRGCLWADGQWVWAGQRWDWSPGVWVRPPEGCRYSAPTLEWAPSDTDKRGILYYKPGRWYSVGAPKACPQPVICPTQRPVPAIAEAALGS